MATSDAEVVLTGRDQGCHIITAHNCGARGAQNAGLEAVIEKGNVLAGAP
jgi:hypothetical protein